MCSKEEIKMEQEKHERLMWDHMSLKNINKFQEVLKPLGYMIIGFREKKNTPIILYLQKI